MLVTAVGASSPYHEDELDKYRTITFAAGPSSTRRYWGLPRTPHINRGRRGERHASNNLFSILCAHPPIAVATCMFTRYPIPTKLTKQQQQDPPPKADQPLPSASPSFPTTHSSHLSSGRSNLSREKRPIYLQGWGIVERKAQSEGQGNPLTLRRQSNA